MLRRLASVPHSNRYTLVFNKLNIASYDQHHLQYLRAFPRSDCGQGAGTDPPLNSVCRVVRSSGPRVCVFLCQSSPSTVKDGSRSDGWLVGGQRSRGVRSPAGSWWRVSWRKRASRRAGRDGMWWLGSNTLVLRRSRSWHHMTYGLGGKKGRERSLYSCSTMPDAARTAHTAIRMKSKQTEPGEKGRSALEGKLPVTAHTEQSFVLLTVILHVNPTGVLINRAGYLGIEVQQRRSAECKSSHRAPAAGRI